ncbi:galanin peptides isoform X2 [Pipistrellus kuhlii]|uniref:galanin peptides isoform X2 n=1 Tax=Pipistrellus kuhlii TaxID=59472 RepID=UPI00174F2992|nr:galanin peptides isoform X2 [Pipistrellus kuhlii]
MSPGGALLLASLLLAALPAARGSPVKEKRGWTLNSAGYLLGPHAVDNHRSFNDKHGGLAGKRDLRPEDGAGAEAGALLPMLPSAASWEDTELPARREPGRALPPQDARL